MTREALFATIAEDFTLYSRAYRSSMPACDADTARRMERVLQRFAAATHYDDDGNEVDNPAPGSPKTIWDDPEDAAVAFVMAANWEAIQAMEPTLVDYFALREGPAFVVDAMFRTWSYRFESSFSDDGSVWAINRLPEGRQGAGTLRSAAWHHLRARHDAAPEAQRSAWLPARASSSVLGQCAAAWMVDDRAKAEGSVAAAQAALADAPPVRGANTSGLADWVLDQLRPRTHSFGAELIEWLRPPKPSKRR
jgi:hypothetical protein